MKGYIKRLLREVIDNRLPRLLRGNQIEKNIIGRDRICVRGKINLSSIDIILDNGIKTAMNKLASDKSFRVSKSPIVVGVDIDSGMTQLLDGYHRYVYNNGMGIMDSYFIPMKNGEIIDFKDI